MSGRLAKPERAGLGRWLVSAAVVAALAFESPGSPPAGASTVSGARVRNGLVFFDRIRATRGDIFAIRPDRSGFHRVVRNGLQPAVSKDGRLVAFQGESSHGFAGGYNLAVMQPDGSRRRVIPTQSEAPESPSFSPDGTEIVFDDGARGIWAVNTDGSHLRHVASFAKTHPGQPEFAPDGQSILFTQFSRRTGNSIGLFVMNPDGKKVRAIPHTRRAGEASFSRDGKAIVFAGRHDSIYRVRIDGSRLRRLTHPPTRGRGGGPPPSDDSPRLSPDGRKIVFIRSAGSLPGGRWSGPHGVYVMNPNGSHLRQLKHGAWSDPAWQPLP